MLGVGNGIPLRLGWRVRRTRLSAGGLVGRVRRTRLSADGGWRARRARPTFCGWPYLLGLPVAVTCCGWNVEELSGWLG